MTPPMTENARPSVVVSRCLLGERVRYDGGHKHAPLVIEELAGRFAIIPVCPEVEAGLPVPREPIDFHGDPRAPAAVGKHSRLNVAGLLREWSRRRLAELAASETPVCGFFLKHNSPSCAAVTRKPVFDLHGRPRGKAFGIFAHLALRAFPGAAFGDEHSLSTSRGREDFMALAQSCFHRLTQEHRP